MVVVAAVFMSNLDLWIVNVALVDIGRSFGGTLSSLGGLSWVLNGYAVTLAALLVVAGRFGDRIGHRQVFLGGIALFTASSVACAAAPNLPILVAARVLQAAGAAAQLPTSLALLLASVAPAARMHAARSWSAVGALAAVCGPVLGGILVSASWRWVFLVNLPVGVLAIAVGARVLPRPEAHAREPLPDLIGSALLTASVAALTGALVEAPTWGWNATSTLALLALAAASAIVFVQRCRHHPYPLLELPLLRIRNFAVANVATFLFSAAFAIMLLSNALWCQEVWGYSPLRTGLAMAPGPAMVPVVTFASARLLRRVGAPRVAAAGSLVFAISLILRAVLAGSSRNYAVEVLPSMLIGGIGVGLALGTLIASAATALPQERSATASAIVNSGRQIASSLGVAVLVTALGTHLVTGGATHAFDLGWSIAAVLALIAAGASLGIPHPAQVQVVAAEPVAA